MAASLFAWLFNFVELTCLPAALKALILHSFFLFSYVNALKCGFFFVYASFQHFWSLQILLFLAVFLHIDYTETTQ